GSITAGLKTVVAVGAKPTTVRCIGANGVTNDVDGAKFTVCTVAVGAKPTVWTTGIGAKLTVCTVGTPTGTAVVPQPECRAHRFIRMWSSIRPGYQWFRAGCVTTIGVATTGVETTGENATTCCGCAITGENTVCVPHVE